MEEFHKVRRLPPYVFEQVNRLKASARSRGADIIDLGMGNPDLPTPKAIVDKLCEVVRDPRTHRYSSSRGIPGLRRAQAGYYARRFGVKLDPETQVVATLGSKEGFANMAQAITAPGDVILCPNPTYPIHAFGFIMSGGVIRSLQVEPDAGFIPALERAIRHSIPKPLALILNYPSNPTALVATLDFYKDVVAFAPQARHHHPVRSRLFRDLFRRRAAALGAAGPRRDGCRGRVHLDVEDLLHARLAHGFCGRQRAADLGADQGEVLSRLRRLHADPGGGDRRAQRRRRRHRRGARRLPQAPRRDDRHVRPRRLGRSRAPPASMFAWAPIPEPFRGLGSLEFSKLLIEKADVAVAPGVGFGEHGDDHVRIALVENEHRIRQAARNIKRFLSSAAVKPDNVVPLTARR